LSLWRVAASSSWWVVGSPWRQVAGFSLWRIAAWSSWWVVGSPWRLVAGLSLWQYHRDDDDFQDYHDNDPEI
jgi:hypothetical protein